MSFLNVTGCLGGHFRVHFQLTPLGIGIGIELTVTELSSLNSVHQDIFSGSFILCTMVKQNKTKKCYV